jgi:hypothetical protein
MSLLADPPLLFSSGAAYARVAPERDPRPALAAVLALFWSVSVPLYANARWTRPVWRVLPYRDGRDFMVNFPGLRVDTRKAGPRMHVLAAAVFATYPLWLWLGWTHGRRAS